MPYMKRAAVMKIEMMIQRNHFEATTDTMPGRRKTDRRTRKTCQACHSIVDAVPSSKRFNDSRDCWTVS